ncbi:JRAB [Mytilus edulis]|uniref:MICALL2 n=1 Tax=Mytilus edulis TaxID=6550 RepID=A0A8S3PQY6_MYTED|nr:JRAB [Mytilus edulis]
METLLEQQRRYHEERERLQDAMTKEMLQPSKNGREQINSDQRLRHLLDVIQEEEDDKMMVEWFELVNNKNELVRKEADLIYLSRAQELEGEQNEIDRQLRALLLKNEKYKTEKDKVEEEQLIQKLLDVVNQRNIIVESSKEDRIRYEEEDKDIALALQGILTYNHFSFYSSNGIFIKMDIVIEGIKKS